MKALLPVLMAAVLGGNAANGQQIQPSPGDYAAEIEALKKRVDALEREKAQSTPIGAQSLVLPQPAPPPAIPPLAPPPGPAAMPPPASLPPVVGPGAPLPDVLDTALQRVPFTSEPVFAGWIVHVLMQPSHPTDLPKRDVGSFVWTSQAPTTLAAFRNEGIKFDGGAAYLLTGWLRVAQAGGYQVGVTIRSPVNRLLTEDMRCSVAMQVGHAPLGEESTQLVLRKGAVWTGDVDLKPGLYPISAEIRCPGVVGKLAADRAIVESYEILTIVTLPGDPAPHKPSPDLIVHARLP